MVKYNASEKGRAAIVKYNASENGRAVNARREARKIRIGDSYHSMADTVEQADMIKAHISARLAEFNAAQAAEREHVFVT